MPTKIFTTIGGNCPFGRKCAVDSTECRKCEWFYRTGTATFFWCRHPEDQKKPKTDSKKPAPLIADPVKKHRAKKTQKPEAEKKKRGRPAKYKPVQVIKQSTK